MSEIKYVQTESGAVMRETTIAYKIAQHGLVSVPVADVPKWFGEQPMEGLPQERLFVSTLLSFLAVDATHEQRQAEIENEFQQRTDEARQQIDDIGNCAISYNDNLTKQRINITQSHSRPILRPEKTIEGINEQLQQISERTASVRSKLENSMRQLVQFRRQRLVALVSLFSLTSLILLACLFFLARFIVAEIHYRAAANAFDVRDWVVFDNEVQALLRTNPDHRVDEIRALESQAKHPKIDDHLSGAESAIEVGDWSRFDYEIEAARRIDPDYRTSDIQVLINSKNKALAKAHFETALQALSDGNPQAFYGNIRMARLIGGELPITDTMSMRETAIQLGEIRIPAGVFVMAMTVLYGYINYHEYKIYLDTYWIGTTEVTNAMYAWCVGDGSCAMPKDSEIFNDPAYNDFPVVNVTWQDAQDYCLWTNRRLPTEAEWVKAARGTDERAYPWGSNEPANSRAFSVGLQKVGGISLDSSPFGIQDMQGNVSEWVNDWYDISYRDTINNPTGPQKGSERVVRGSNWREGLDTRIGYHYGRLPSTARDDLGFRCARSEIR